MSDRNAATILQRVEALEERLDMLRSIVENLIEDIPKCD